MTARVLDREEYIEQSYFFQTFRERLADNLPSQEILSSLGEEILATTQLPMAIDFLRSEILHQGRFSEAMARLPHYFTAFQTFVITRSEEDKARFDQSTALEVLERLAEYLAGEPSPAGVFIYQFECIARNRLGYDAGMTAMGADPMFDEEWQGWIKKIRLRLGSADFSDLIYYRSQHYVDERRRSTGRSNYQPPFAVLFGSQEGRIAKANRGKDPLFMFAALQRQIGHPSVPRPKRYSDQPVIHPALEQRLQRLEKRVQLLENEVKGDLDLSQFMKQSPSLSDDPSLLPPDKGTSS